MAILTGKGTSFIFQQCFAPKGLCKYNYFLILEQILKQYIMNIKIGDVVYLNSNPEIKMTVTYVTGDKIQATYCNPITGKFECSPTLSIEAISLVKEKNS
ncbi:hypothetical protein [Bacteroides xylanisolvens]|uniref:hypothetical protein n=2 Tax=Bacteroides TaxID=816 RepID=UPI0034A3091B